jgi:hypothetical protein
MTVLLVLSALVIPAYGYTLKIDVKEDRLELKQAPLEGDTMFGYGDLTIEIETQNMGGRQWRLCLLAVDDMRGGQVIPASEVTWDAMSPRFIDGRLAKGVPQIMAEGTGDQRMLSKVRFFFKGKEYDAGFYDTQIRFILSSP